MGIKLLGMVFVIIAAWKSHERDLKERADNENDEEVQNGFRSSNRSRTSRSYQSEQIVAGSGAAAASSALTSRLRAYSPAVHHQVQHSIQDSTLGALHETNEESEPLSDN